MIIIYIILFIILLFLSTGFINKILWTTPLDNFSRAMKKICIDLDISTTKKYKFTEEDEDKIHRYLNSNKNVTWVASPMIRDWMLFYIQNSLSWLVWFNAAEISYRMHMEVARIKFKVDVKDSFEKIGKDKDILYKHFWYFINL